ncbi:hypothetical protein BH18ACT1_BH18ACT1_11130 [soil metagenome]
MLKAATRELEVERDALVRHKDQLESWREETAAQSRRMRNLWALADEAHTRLLGGMTAEEQAQVLPLLEVRVTVLGWTVCEHCTGKGKVRGGTGGLTCPEYRGARQLPSLRIEGTVLDDLLLEAVNVGHLSDAVLRRSLCC